METMHIVDAAGRWETGADAWLSVATVIPALRPLATLGGLPLLRGFTRLMYALVARNRRRLSRILRIDRCGVEGADR
jgi:predicted DCC family thiol-disulfide oxidoreductase YuxK